MLRKVASYLLVFPFIFKASSALAQSASNCMVNGQEVPCEEVQQAIGSFLAWGSSFILLFWVAGIAATVFWIMMIVHAASKPVEGKAAWIILMIFTHFLGALIYYFAVKRSFKK